MGIPIVCGPYINTFIGFFLILITVLAFSGDINAFDGNVILIFLFFIFGLIMVLTDRPFYYFFGHRLVKYQLYRAIFWLNPLSSLNYASPEQAKKMELKVRSQFDPLIRSSTQVTPSDRSKQFNLEAKAVYTQLKLKEGIDDYNDHKYESAISKMTQLLEVGYLSLKEKLTIKSYIALCYYHLEEYQHSYSNIKDVVNNRTKISAKIEDDLLKYLCEIKLGLTEESILTEKKAQEYYPDKPNLRDMEPP